MLDKHREHPNCGEQCVAGAGLDRLIGLSTAGAVHVAVGFKEVFRT